MRGHDLPGPGDLALAQMDREERDARQTMQLNELYCACCDGVLIRCDMCGEAKPEASIVRDGGGEWCPTCAAKALNDYHTETLKLQARIDGMRALINRTCGEVIAIAEGKAS
jgi:hypothetical protein